VTEVLVRRGDQQVVRKVAENRGARFSNDSFAKLVHRAEHDDRLAEMVGLRPDIPLHLFHELLLKATEIVQQRLFAAAKPELQPVIRRVLAKVSSEVAARSGPRDYTAAQRTIEALHREGRLTEAQVSDFARSGRYEETIAAISGICEVPLPVVDRLMAGGRSDPVLIVCKAVGWGWPTAKALIILGADGQTVSSHSLDQAFANFERLSPMTAQRVMRFWQARMTVNAN
jgi:uncharacterized protein (DUF2336 family)